MQRGVPTRRVCVVAAACAVLPDIDAVAWPLHLSYASLFAHRAITHSITFALMAAALATVVCFRGSEWRQGRARIAFILGVALLSHACLDALSTYSRGVEFFAPFSQERFRFPWTPLGRPNGTFVGQEVQEVVFVLLPAVLAGWLGIKAHGASETGRVK
jgi:inner membrane protein